MGRAKKQKNNDYFLMVSAILLLTMIGLIIDWSSFKKESVAWPGQQKMEVIGSAVFTVDFGDGKKRSFEGKIVKGETPMDVFIQSSQAGNFSYKFDEKSGLAAVDNFIKNSDKSWHWYLNGEKITKPYEVSLKADDSILVRYE